MSERRRRCLLRKRDQHFHRFPGDCPPDAAHLESEAPCPPTPCSHIDFRPGHHCQRGRLCPHRLRLEEYGRRLRHHMARMASLGCSGGRNQPWLGTTNSVHYRAILRTNKRTQICSSAPALRPLIAAFLPRLLNSTRNITSSYNKQGRSQKQLWSSARRSRTPHMVTGHDSRHTGYESDRFEIMRTVEMETWSESRVARHDHMGRVYDLDACAVKPGSEFDIKQNTVVITSAASSTSGSLSDSISGDGHCP